MTVRWTAWIALLGSLAGCAEQPAATIVGVPADRIELRATRGEFREVLYLTGEVESAGGENIVVPRIPNWQTTVQTLVKDGTRVAAGDVVAELDSTQFSSGLEQRKQGLTDAVQSITQQLARNEAELAQKEFDLEQKRVALEKARSAARVPKDILPLRDWEENQLAHERAEAEYRKARNDLDSERKSGEAEVANLRLSKASAEREIAIAEAALASLTLRAESEGVVSIGENGMTGRKLQTGDTVWVGMRIATIPDLSALRVTATLVDVDDGKIDIGMPVEVVADAFPERRFRGKVASIGTVAETLTQNSLRRGFYVTIELEDADRELLRPGYSVRAAIEVAREEGALLVPRESVDFVSADPVVAGPNGTPIEAARIGACNARQCRVLSGLTEGDRLGRAAEVVQ